MFGEIGFKVPGLTSNTTETHFSLTLTSTDNSSLVSTGALIFSGSSLSVGSSKSPIFGNAAEINFGKSAAQRMICLYDNGTLGNDDQNQFYGFGITASTLHYSVGFTGAAHKFYAGTSSTTSNLLFTIAGSRAISSANNTLDDGSGNMTVASNLTVSGLTASVPVLTNSGSQLVSGQINLASTSFVTGILSSANGGTGVNNGTSTITIGGSVTYSGAFTFTGVLTGNTNVTFPQSGILATTTAIYQDFYTVSRCGGF